MVRMIRRVILTIAFILTAAAVSQRAVGQVLPEPPKTEPESNPPASQPTVVLKPGEKPFIEFESMAFDWGKAKGHTTVRTDFIFKNIGNGTLEILNVKPACSCTVPQEYTRIVEPGGTGHIPVELATGKYSGRVTKTINVESNCEGDRKTITLTMQGEVWQVIQVEPPSASFGRLEQQVETERVIKIQSNIDAPLELADVESSSKTFTVTHREKEPGKVYELVVKAVPPFSPGSNSGRITFKTNYPEFPTMELQAYAYAPELVEVTPPTITVPLGSRTPIKRKVQIRNHHTKPFKVSNPQATQPGVKCTLTELQAGKAYELVVEFPAGFKAAVAGERISFKTDIENMPTVNIPITMQGGTSLGPLPGMVAPPKRTPTSLPATPPPDKVQP